MAKTMKAAFVEKFGEPLKIKEVPVPDPGPGQALVQVVASGVCHTDLHAADGDWPIILLCLLSRGTKARDLWRSWARA